MGHTRSHFWFVSPAVILMFVILILPVFVAGAFSFTDYNLGSTDFKWIGWKNYESLGKFSSYSKMFTASLTYVVIVVPVSVLLGLGSAMLISSLRFGGEFYKAIFFLPVMATLLAMAYAWEFALDPVMGVINKVLDDGCSVGWFYKFFTGSWLGFNPTESWYGGLCSDRMPNWLGNKNMLWVLFLS